MPGRPPPALALALLALGCLPTPIASRDGGTPPPDASDASTPFTIVGLEVASLDGRAHEPDDAPRTMRLTLRFSSPPAHDDDDPVVFVLTGTPDDELLDDLRAAPLRVAHRARALPIELDAEGNTLALTLTQRPRGEHLTVAVAGWARSLEDERLPAGWARPLRVSEAAEAGATVTDSWPADGAAAIAPSLERVAVRFDGPVIAAYEGLRVGEATTGGVQWLSGSARDIECATVGWPDGWCAAFTPDRPLTPGVEHHVSLDEPARDATGAPVGPFRARFHTSSVPDERAPTFTSLPCALDEWGLAERAPEAPPAGGCVLVDDRSVRVRVELDEPVRVFLRAAGRVRSAVAPRGAATLTLWDLPPDTAFEAALEAIDAAGLTTRVSRTLATTPPLATVAITEVRADPLGAEPRQELVEVLNFGAVPLDLTGLSLSDRADGIGDVITQPAVLAPGQRALLVADAFDPDDEADVPVPPGVPLVRVGRSLASGGLTNAGEALYLRDVALRRLSAVPARTVPAGQCLVRVSDDPRTDADAAFVIGPCTPGRAP